MANESDSDGSSAAGSSVAGGSVDGAQQLRVELAGRSYSIHVGRGLLGCAGRLISTALPGANHAVVMFDQNVENVAEAVDSQLAATGCRVSKFAIPAGEASKSVAQAERLWNGMLSEHTDRGSVVIAVGGGVVGDLAGFMAASFARGISLVQVPTTLLSQVDSSVGGKTGINLPGTKNIVGAFWQPSLVLIDAETLDSLPAREYVSGLAEVAKYGVIISQELFEYLEQHADSILRKDQASVEHIVLESCQAKATVVAEDERETSGRRAILNYGHTFAHALESVTGYGTLLHGEAVAIGMHMAAHLAHRLGRVDVEFVRRQAALLKLLQLPTTCPQVEGQAMWDAMQHDKKMERGTLRFVLPSRLGQVELVSGVTMADTLAAISAAR